MNLIKTIPTYSKYICVYLVLGIYPLIASDDLEFWELELPEPIWWECHLWIPYMFEHHPQCPCGYYDKYNDKTSQYMEKKI